MYNSNWEMQAGFNEMTNTLVFIIQGIMETKIKIYEKPGYNDCTEFLVVYRLPATPTFKILEK